MCSNIVTDEGVNHHQPKRKAFELITNIFRKKTKEINRDNQYDENHPPQCDGLLSPNVDHHIIHGFSNTRIDRMSQDYGIPPHSPVSPRVKNIDEDMEALTLSRQDNPYLMNKLERLSACSEFLSQSNLTINVSTGERIAADGQNLQEALITMDLDDINDDKDDLHDHLIRSPPPQFPQRVSHFVFPSPNSPIRSLSLKYANFLSPMRNSTQQMPDCCDNSVNNNCQQPTISIPVPRLICPPTVDDTLTATSSIHRNSITIGEVHCTSDELRRLINMNRRGSESSVKLFHNGERNQQSKSVNNINRTFRDDTVLDGGCGENRHDNIVIHDDHSDHHWNGLGHRCRNSLDCSREALLSSSNQDLVG